MDNKTEKSIEARFMSKTEFAHLGEDSMAYIKELTSDKAQELFPALENIPEGIKIFAVHAADGTPIALADTRSAAISNAKDHNLHPVSIH